MRALGVVAAVVVLAVAPVAQAKGPSQASVAGPGLDAPIALAGDGEDGGSQLGVVTQAAGFFPAVFGQEPDPMLAARPRGPLGPRYTITYRVPGPARVDVIEQALYPYAHDGAVTYLRPGQRIFDTTTRGGWFAAWPGLRPTLVGLGLPVKAPAQPAAEAAGTGASGSSEAWPYFVAAVLAAGSLAGAAGVLARRRAGRVRP